MDSSFKQTLKARAHSLKPVVLLGSKGLTAAVVDETNTALVAHELIKIKISGVTKEDRQVITEQLCQQSSAQLVQLIGNTAIIYRANPKK